MLAISNDASAYYSPSYGHYGYAYTPSYGPYSYHFVPRSFWGHYYNPNYYYATLDYSTRNNLVRAQQQNLQATYNFISYNT